MSPLAHHVIPHIGTLPVEELDQLAVKRVPDPIWHEKPDTARKALNRLNLTLRHAAALGLNVDLQATMKAREHDIDNIKALLDALTGIVWEDDGQIVELRTTKAYDKADPHVHMEVDQIAA